MNPADSGCDGPSTMTSSKVLNKSAFPPLIPPSTGGSVPSPLTGRVWEGDDFPRWCSPAEVNVCHHIYAMERSGCDGASTHGVPSYRGLMNNRGRVPLVLDCSPRCRVQGEYPRCDHFIRLECLFGPGCCVHQFLVLPDRALCPTHS
jgi:hypothetical protein